MDDGEEQREERKREEEMNVWQGRDGEEKKRKENENDHKKVVSVSLVHTYM